jgi:hypothetical protein
MSSKQSMKCTQPNAVNKMYRKEEDGTLLSGPPAPNDEEEDVGAIIAANDVERMDLIPWDANYQSDIKERNPFALLPEKAGDDDDAVVVVGGGGGTL